MSVSEYEIFGVQSSRASAAITNASEDYAKGKIIDAAMNMSPSLHDIIIANARAAGKTEMTAYEFGKALGEIYNAMQATRKQIEKGFDDATSVNEGGNGKRMDKKISNRVAARKRRRSSNRRK